MYVSETAIKFHISVKLVIVSANSYLFAWAIVLSATYWQMSKYCTNKSIESGFFGCCCICIDIAQHLPRCHHGDTSCIAETMNTFVRDYKAGLRDINLVSLEPLRVNKVDIIQSADSPVNINLVFKNISLYGLSNMKAKSVV